MRLCCFRIRLVPQDMWVGIHWYKFHDGLLVRIGFLPCVSLHINFMEKEFFEYHYGRKQAQ
jgi:hypothetical protein